MATAFSENRGEVVISRFKGLGEMMPAQLRETAMDPATRHLVRVCVRSEDRSTADIVERLMGRKAAPRYRYICENAQFAEAV